MTSGRPWGPLISTTARSGPTTRANLNVLDADFGQEQARIFEDDRARSRRVTLEEWERRPVKERVQEHLARLVKSQP